MLVVDAISTLKGAISPIKGTNVDVPGKLYDTLEHTRVSLSARISGMHNFFSEYIVYYGGGIFGVLM